MNKKLLTAIISTPFIACFLASSTVSADNPPLFSSPLAKVNAKAIFASEDAKEVTNDYSGQHAKNEGSGTEADKMSAKYPRIAVNISESLEPQFERKSAADLPSPELFINSDAGNRAYMSVRVLIPEDKVRNLESEACEEPLIECKVPGDDGVIIKIKGKSIASKEKPGQFDVTYTYTKPGAGGDPDKEVALKVFSDEEDPSRKYFIISSRKARLPAAYSRVEAADTADRYNEYYRASYAELPTEEQPQSEVIYTACEEPACEEPSPTTATSSFTGEVILARREDIVAAALKYQRPGGKTLVLVTASEVTPCGSPATQSATEECIARNTGLYVRASSGAIDHFYINPAMCPGGCLYNPLKCAILRNVPIYCDDTARLLPGITPRSISGLPKMDFLLHASRNANPEVGGACPPKIHPDSALNSTYTKLLKDWHSSTGTEPSDKIQEISALMKNEIDAFAKQIICLARKKGYSTVVFNNPGGGVFRNGTTAYATALAQAIKSYGGNMRIVFTIFDDDIAPNRSKLLPSEPPANVGKMNCEIYENALTGQKIEFKRMYSAKP